MPDDGVVFTVFLVFTGAAAVATLALYARQSLLVAYVLLGVLFGPSALGLVSDPALVRDLSHFGIIFLLFLLGLNLNPRELLQMVRKTTTVTLASSLIFAAAGGAIALAFGFAPFDTVVIAVAMTFSSTIIGLKLLPTSVLHHQRTGEVIISILLLQDLVAIVVLLVLRGLGAGDLPLVEVALLLCKLPLLMAVAFALDRFVLLPLLVRFDKITEYVFLLAVGWCLGIAELSDWLGLSAEIGAFVAGIALATSPIARFISESLKPLRDFFLVLFFFSLGAGFDLSVLPTVVLPGLALAAVSLVVKPPVFRWLLRRTGESDKRAREVGYRLGQLSEFSLLMAVVAAGAGACSAQASFVIQFATLVSFLASSYLVVMRFPTPIAVNDELRLD
jgi:Kef-type K+ transport system membrane component KefB